MSYFATRVLELMDRQFKDTVFGHHCLKDNPHLSCQAIRVCGLKDGRFSVTCGGDRSQVRQTVNSREAIADAIDIWAFKKDEEFRMRFLEEANRLANVYDPNSPENIAKAKLEEIKEFIRKV